MQLFFKHLLIYFIAFFFFLPAQAQRKNTIHTVVIDAGHGGFDPGALGKIAKEKSVNLSIALKLGNMIQRNMQGVRVIYTRDRDNFVELYRRAEIANENKADLFISIHCNANNSHTLKGAETYIMGLHKSEANLNTAKLENASILLESDYQATYNGFDPNSDESYIIFSLNQNSNLDQSTDFAADIQTQMEERVGLNNRGVRQAGFMVLYKTTMPSVLVEAGYLSNPVEEKFLVSDKGQEYIASAIYRAFKYYREKLENPVKSMESTGRNEILKKESTQVVRPRYDSTPLMVAKTSPSSLSFRIQIGVSTTDIGVHSSKFASFPAVKMYKHGGMFKYTVGDESTLEGAKRLLIEVKQKGVRDAFIVIFKNNQRISQEESSRILGK
ncbi:MAG: N-acetylmuramoyl-L-alanine amidase [Bacteroidales bacterium]|nr:N-acetylmuramoyl-L-alanine amidase [Bacteroidales bacterium]